uniref:Uncharacterized protein n=1 Tax=Peronospora matthiolae TaxID=2874970 RepID=A0AAV1TBQ8_9STRA
MREKRRWLDLLVRESALSYQKEATNMARETPVPIDDRPSTCLYSSSHDRYDKRVPSTGASDQFFFACMFFRVFRIATRSLRRSCSQQPSDMSVAVSSKVGLQCANCASCPFLVRSQSRGRVFFARATKSLERRIASSSSSIWTSSLLAVLLHERHIVDAPRLDGYLLPSAHTT